MRRRRTLALAAAAVLALAGTGAALAARGHGTRPVLAAVRLHHAGGDILAAAATYLGVPEDQLRSDLQGGKTLAQVAAATSGKSSAGLVAALVADAQQRLAAAVSAGRLTQVQADGITARLQQQIADLVDGTRPAFPRPGFGHRPDVLAAAATYLGVPEDQLRSDLQGGKTLAQVAAATSGKSSAGLVAALVADAQQKLAAAVSAGKLTQAQADAITARLQAGVTALVDGTRPAFPRGGFRFDRPGHGGWGGTGGANL